MNSKQVSLSSFWRFITLFFLKASIHSSPLSIISTIKNARIFANGYEKHLLHTQDFLAPSEMWGINDNWGPSLVLFLFLQFFLFVSPDFSDFVVVPPSKRIWHTSNSLCFDTRLMSIENEVVMSISDIGLVCFDTVGWYLVDVACKSQPSLRSYCMLIIIKYPYVKTWMHTSIGWNRQFNFKNSVRNHNLHKFMFIFTLLWIPTASSVHIGGLRCYGNVRCEALDAYVISSTGSAQLCILEAHPTMGLDRYHQVGVNRSNRVGVNRRSRVGGDRC